MIDPFTIGGVRRKHYAIWTERLARIESDGMTHHVTGGQIFNSNEERSADARCGLERSVIAETVQLHAVERNRSTHVAGDLKIELAVEYGHPVLGGYEF